MIDFEIIGSIPCLKEVTVHNPLRFKFNHVSRVITDTHSKLDTIKIINVVHMLFEDSKWEIKYELFNFQLA